MSIRFVVAAVLTAAQPAVAQTNVPRRQLVEDLRLDATTEDFPDLWTVQTGPGGQMVVMIGNDQQLRFYDQGGKKTATFGRKGSGPGEFRRATRYGWIADTLWVYDVEQRRVTYISPKPALIRSEVLAARLNSNFTSGSTGAGAILSFSPHAVAGERYVGQAIVSTGPGRGGTVASESRIMAISTRAARDSAVAGERSFLATMPPTEAATVGYQPGDGSSYSAIVPFMFYPVTQFSPDGSRFGMLSTEAGPTGGTYTVTMFSTRGDSIYRRMYPVVGTPIPSATVDSAINAIGVGSDGKQFFPPAVATKLREQVKPKMPKFYSPVSGLVLGPDGSTWIQTRRTPQGSSAIAMDAKGNILFTAELPPRTLIVQANRTTLWTIQTDDDDLPSVVRYRVR